MLPNGTEDAGIPLRRVEVAAGRSVSLHGTLRIDDAFCTHVTGDELELFVWRKELCFGAHLCQMESEKGNGVVMTFQRGWKGNERFVIKRARFVATMTPEIG